MGAHLITGYAGKEHITSADQGAYNAGTIGSGKYVLETGRMFECEQINSNLVKIHSGDLMNQGRHIRISTNDYVECMIDNGLQGLKRNDLIVMRYSKNKDTDIENVEVLVLKGTSGETATDPDYLTGDILNGDMEDDFLLYRVKLDGIEVESVEPLFNVITPASEMQERLTEIRTTLENKQNTITGAATTVAANNLTASRALVSGSSGKIEASAITSAQLGCLSGITSNIQTQINSLRPEIYVFSITDHELVSGESREIWWGQLPIGKYIWSTQVRFAQNSTGYRRVFHLFGTNGIGSETILQANQSGMTVIQLSGIVNVTVENVLGVYAQQNCGSNLTSTGGYITIVKIA